MRQVPHYLIIGSGRLATHLQHYFFHLQLGYDTWCRQRSKAALAPKLEKATHVLLAISDDAIETWIQEALSGTTAMRIHFSGRLVSEHAYGAHPLMTFTRELYVLRQYQAIPFVIYGDAPPFEQLFPGLLNPSVRLQRAQKEKYHALCVMSGNFSCMLWQKLLTTFEREFGFDASIAHPYLQQQTQNIMRHYQQALTGPLVRQDRETLERDRNALAGDPFQAIFDSFVSCYQTLKKAGEA